MYLIKTNKRNFKNKFSPKFLRKQAERIKKEILSYYSVDDRINKLKSIAEHGRFKTDDNYTLLRNFPLPELKGKCEVCLENEAYCWHHIKPLCHGGNNADYNLVKVCLECHQKIHPFMDS